MGIRENTKIEVIDVQPFYGPITVKVGNSNHVIGRNLSMRIGCELID